MKELFLKHILWKVYSVIGFVSPFRFTYTLEQACIQFFYQNYEVLQTDKIIEQINPSVILSLTKNNISEMEEHDIFTLVSKWIVLTNPCDNAKKEILSHIRLPIMSANFLADHVEKSGLFSERELLEAYKYQACLSPSTELKFQKRTSQFEIFIGQNTSTFNDYRKIVNADIKSKNFRKHLIECAKKNGDRFRFIGPHVRDNAGLMTDNNLIIISNSIICVAEVTNDWARLMGCDLQSIYNKSEIMDVKTDTVTGTRYSFFVNKGVTFD